MFACGPSELVRGMLRQAIGIDKRLLLHEFPMGPRSRLGLSTPMGGNIDTEPLRLDCGPAAALLAAALCDVAEGGERHGFGQSLACGHPIAGVGSNMCVCVTPSNDGR